MKKKILALTLAALMVLPAAQAFAETPAEIAPAFPAIYTSLGMTPDYAAPISRAQFSMLTFEAFRTINSGVFPQLETKNNFADLGEAPEDIFVVMLYGMGVVNGVGNDAFAPRRAITRQEACSMLTRAKLRQNPDCLADIQAATASIAGVADEEQVASWALESVAYMYSTGCLSLKDGNLAPEAEMTTEEAMLLCTAYIGA
ncbi:MAG: S-layer homology domain-containing protein [Ruminococcaceae bacterium]|nr:S-layer homology domain-containing protein [Oscillospiraceae bacterium]